MSKKDEPTYIKAVKREEVKEALYEPLPISEDKDVQEEEEPTYVKAVNPEEVKQTLYASLPSSEGEDVQEENEKEPLYARVGPGLFRSHKIEPPPVPTTPIPKLSKELPKYNYLNFEGQEGETEDPNYSLVKKNNTDSKDNTYIPLGTGNNSISPDTPPERKTGFFTNLVSRFKAMFKKELSFKGNPDHVDSADEESEPLYEKIPELEHEYEDIPDYVKKETTKIVKDAVEEENSQGGVKASSASKIKETINYIDL